MKLQRGFSVIELIVVMAVSSILMSILLEIYAQVGRNMRRIDRLVFEDTQLLTLRNRFDQDISGMCALWFTQADLESKQAKKDGKKTDDAQQEKKLTSQYFYSINKDKDLNTLTFITTNAFNRFVRVMYKLEQDPAHQGLSRLMRKEIPLPTENIAEQKGGQETSWYELAGGIKSLEMTYQLIDKKEIQRRAAAEKEAEKNNSKPASGEQKSIIRSVTQWTSDTKKNKDTKKDAGSHDDASDEQEQDLGGAVSPKMVTMKITFGATRQQLEKEYQLDFYIPQFIDAIVKLPNQQAETPAPGPDKDLNAGGVAA